MGGYGSARGAMSTNYVSAGYLYMTLTETTGNIWLLDVPKG